MKKNNIFWLLLLVLTVCSSCHTAKEVTYLSDATYDSAYAIIKTYNTQLHVGDRLYIHVDSETPESVVSFNQETNTVLRNSAESIQQLSLMQEGQTAVKEGYSFGGVSGYLVSQQGTIEFPILGTVAVRNLTQDSLAKRLQTMLEEGNYVSDPVVTIRLMNFHVSVVGEVKTPRMVFADGHRLTILEALAQAGDVSFYGRRDSIRIVRDEGDGAHLATIDLTKTAFLSSPYYYLQPNDIIYVEANDRRKHEARDEQFVEDVNRYAGIMRTAINTAQQLQNTQHFDDR